MDQLIKDEHKVQKIPIDRNFMRRMELLGYNTNATKKRQHSNTEANRKIQIIYEQLKEKVKQHKVSHNKNKDIKNISNYICSISVRVGNELEKAKLIEVHDDPADDIDPQEWTEQQVNLKWEKSGIIERISMNRVKEVIEHKYK